MKMRKLSFLLFAFWQVCLFAGNYEVLSPDGKLKGGSHGFRCAGHGGFL